MEIERRRARGRATLAGALLLPLLLTACGTERAGAAGGPASAAPSGAPVDTAELKRRAGETALEHVYVTGVPGFTLAAQSVGVIGDDGFGGTYVSREGGGRIELTVDRGTLPPDGCEGCVRDGAHWYEATGGGGAYVRAEGGHLVRLVGTGVERATLKRAAERAHHASPEEMDAVLPKTDASSGAAATGGTGGTGGGPVVRGDLPPVGDGAPRDDVGASG
ncbi:hypothetical protein ACFYVL_38265 [Streptomyces sp. NPDC004111]|uniref:hypothetical protein n=1 Tax=Streptomyces sp. NPDC004111 TaxID=3364690 RepID=UPI0036770A09